MGGDDINTALAHVVLCCVSGRGASRMSVNNYTNPGMHTNFFIHGLLGLFNNQSSLLGNDFEQAYTISLKATKYLALPCLMADLYQDKKLLSLIHLLSGVVPFALSLSGQDNAALGNMVIACNLISLCYFSFQTSQDWGFFTAGAGVFAYILSPQMGQKMMYPLGLALMEYCAYKVSPILSIFI